MITFARGLGVGVFASGSGVSTPQGRLHLFYRRFLTYLVTIALGITSAGVAARLRDDFSKAASGSVFADDEKNSRKIPKVDVARGWSLRKLRELPESVNSLLYCGRESGAWGTLYVGTAPRGCVYRFNATSPIGIATIAEGMGDQVRYGVCNVNRLVLCDLDHDGNAELIASTSQVQPAGRPRLYVWSLNGARPEPRGVARPNIRSNWSHGFGLVPGASNLRDRVFLTFCGYGEIVEYRLESFVDERGFQSEALAWKQVGQLPASGEWIETTDLDRDGQPELCVATGYAPNSAAIHLYEPGEGSAGVRFKLGVDENRRFGNVRFVVGDFKGDGSSELIAWWCTDYVYGGRCEMIRYQIGANGIESRELVAESDATGFWPDDAQSAVADLDGNGRPEVWFANRSGNVWRYEPGSPARGPELILKIDERTGPITPALIPHNTRTSLLFGAGNSVFCVERATNIQ